MESTRLDTNKLKVAIDKADKKLDEVFAILEPVLAVLTDEDRASLLRPREGFPAGGRRLARESRNHPDLVKAVDFDADAVVEDLDNVDVLARIEGRAEKLHRLVADSRLRWLHEAYQPSLLLYGMAKIGAKMDGSLRALVDSLAHLFPPGGRRTRKNPDDGNK